jgi:hypothetical protein
MPESGDPPRPAPHVDILRELAVVPVPAGGQDAQLEQIREMQARLDEGAGLVEQFRRNIGQEWADQAPAGEARHLPQGIQYHVADDVRARPPPASSGVGQNLAATAILLRAMPEHRPPKGGVSRESSRISWRMPRSDGPKALPPEGRGTPRSMAPRLPDSCGKPRSTPGARATRRLRPWVASTTSTTTATIEPTSTRGCTEATTPGVGDATTAGRIGAPRPNHPVRRLSAGPYDGRRSRPGFEPRLPSQSTRGRRGRNCGSRTTDWPASWVERTMTTSSSATSPVPLRHRSSLAGASASGAHLQLRRPSPSLRRQLPGHVRAPCELLGSPKLPPAAGRVSPGLHPAVLEVAH